MRRLWEKPSMNIITLELDDIITNSPGSGLGTVDPDTPEGNVSFDDFVNGNY